MTSKTCGVVGFGLLLAWCAVCHDAGYLSLLSNTFLVIASCVMSFLGIAVGAAAVLVRVRRGMGFEGTGPTVVVSQVLLGLALSGALKAGSVLVALAAQLLISATLFLWLAPLCVRILSGVDRSDGAKLIALTMLACGIAGLCAWGFIRLVGSLAGLAALCLVLPPVAGLLVSKACPSGGDAAKPSGSDRRGVRFFVPVRFVLQVSTYSVVFGMMHTLAGGFVGQAKDVPSFLGILGAAVVIAVAFAPSRRERGGGRERDMLWQRMRSVVFPLAMVSFMLLPFAQGGVALPFSFMSQLATASYFGFFLLTCLTISSKAGVAASEVVSAGAIVAALALIGGGLLGLALYFALDLTLYATLSLLVFLLLVAGTFWVGDERTVALAWGAEKKLSPIRFEESNVARRCRAVVAEYGLTKKEAEVLVALVEGYSAAAIAERHVVSINTIRAHISHIHQKTGVHSQQELRALVDAAEPKNHDA